MAAEVRAERLAKALDGPPRFGQDCMMTNEEFRARLRERADLAPSLVGLHVTVATQRAADLGFKTPEVPAGSDVAIPASLDPNRIWLIVNEDKLVVETA